MKYTLYFFTLICISVLLQFSCSGPADMVKGPTLKGKIENADGLQVFFDKVGLDNANEIIAKSDITDDGKFTLSIDDGFEQGLYRLRIGARRLVFPLGGDEKKIEFSGDLNQFDWGHVTVQGSDILTQYLAFTNEHISTPLDSKGLGEKLSTIDDDFLRLAVATQHLPYSEQTIQAHKQAYDQYIKKYPSDSYGQAYGNIILKQQQKIAQSKARGSVSAGSPAPEISLPDPDGNIRNLSDLKGQVVLLDFWASWCGPCRRANPHVVEIYNKYKDDGFTVYSVSLDGIHPRMLSRITDDKSRQQQLDTAKKKWLAAIKKDNLSWDSHVSDLKHWNSPVAKLYGVSSIPRTFLIDRNGNLAARNVRVDKLEAELKKLL